MTLIDARCRHEVSLRAPDNRRQSITGCAFTHFSKGVFSGSVVSKAAKPWNSYFTELHRERERERQTDRQTDRQTETHTERQSDRQRQTERQRQIDTERLTVRQTDREV